MTTDEYIEALERKCADQKVTIIAQKDEIANLKGIIQQVKIKSMAIANLRDAMHELINEATSY